MSKLWQTIFFIDERVPNLEQLVDGVVPGVTVEVLPADQDGVVYISRLLQSGSVDSVQIVAHGAPGCLYLGNAELNLDTLETYADHLAQWFVNAPVQGDLRLYGCNVAAGDAGTEFLAKLHRFTGANIAASTRKIGHSDLGGQWDLEVEVGTITAPVALTSETQATYVGVLVNNLYITTEDNDSQARNNIPDGDFGVQIALAESPIEFDIITDLPAVTNAYLILSVYDVDRAQGELDLVSINDNTLGYLEGENQLDYNTVFKIDDLSFLTTGENFVQIDVDQGQEGWTAVINQATLLINYTLGSSLGNASLVAAATDSTSYNAGDTVNFGAELNTNLASQDLKIETILRDPNGDAVAFDNRVGSANFPIIDSNLDPFTWSVALPANAASGIWSIDMTVFDANTGTLQLLDTEKFAVGNVNLDSDFNFDGSSDFVWRGPTVGAGEQSVWFLNNGNPTGSAKFSVDVADPAWVIEGTGDFDGDGKEDDLAWANYSTNQVSFWLTEYDDQSQMTVVGGGILNIALAPNWQLQGTGDFDGDGLQDDLVFYNQATSQAQIWFLDSGSLVNILGIDATQSINTSGWYVGAVADSDGDGLQDDLVWRNSETGQNSIWFMNGNQVTGTEFLIDVSTNWVLSGASDFNGNLTPDDLLWYDSTTGSATIWYMDGATPVGAVTDLAGAPSGAFYAVV